jgi:hypothetical protein
MIVMVRDISAEIDKLTEIATWERGRCPDNFSGKKLLFHNGSASNAGMVAGLRQTFQLPAACSGTG